jgi:hypothetical protein
MFSLLAFCVCSASAISVEAYKPTNCGIVPCVLRVEPICSAQNGTLVPSKDRNACCPTCIPPRGMIIIGVNFINLIININNIVHCVGN